MASQRLMLSIVASAGVKEFDGHVARRALGDLMVTPIGSVTRSHRIHLHTVGGWQLSRAYSRAFATHSAAGLVQCESLAAHHIENEGASSVAEQVPRNSSYGV